MSNTRYIEVDSRFRNRNEWPNPAEFEIPISQTGKRGAVDALDPVSDAASLVQWTGNRFSTIPANATITVTITTAPAIVNSSSGFTVFVTAPAGELQVFPDYYSGAVLALSGPPAIPIRSRIISYEYLGNDRAQITVFTNITASMVLASTWDIVDPTDFSVLWAPLLFVPGPILANNFLVNRIVYNETLDESRPTGVYNSPTSIVPLVTSESALSTRTSGPITSPWLLSNNFSVRVAIPTFQTTLNSDPTLVSGNPSTTTSFNLPLLTSINAIAPIVSVGGFLEKLRMPSRPVIAGGIGAVLGTTSEIIVLNTGDDPGGGPGNDNFYTGCLIRFITGAPVIGQIRLIVSYTQGTNTIIVEPGFAAASAPLAGNTYTLFCSNESRRIVKYVDFRASALSAPSTTTFVLPATDINGVEASNINGFYNGLYVLATVSTNIRVITGYTVVTVLGVTTRTVTINTAWALPATGAFTITSGIVSPGFTSSICQAPGGGPNNILQNFCYLPFTDDNFNPFVYTGSVVHKTSYFF